MTGKILVVDDEPDVEALISQRFRRSVRAGEYSFLFAHNGEQALQALREVPDIDMILSDINMPGMDGLTLLSRLPEVNPDVRAVMVSAYGDMTNIRTAMNRGAFDFVTKPIDFGDLEATIRKVLAGRQAEKAIKETLRRTQASEAASRAAEQQLRHLLDTSPVGVMIATEAGVVLHSNQRQSDLLGLPQDAMTGRDARSFYADPRRFGFLVERVGKEGCVRDAEAELRDLEGRTVWGLVSIDPMEYEGQRVLIVWFYDITERKRAAEALKVAKEAAEQALAELERTQASLVQVEKMASLGQIVAGVAHEINTPLGIALTSATFLSDETDRLCELAGVGRMRKADFDRYIDGAGETLRLLVANITRAADLVQSFKQVAADQTSSERRRFDLGGYLAEVMLSLGPQVRATPHAVSLDCPPGLEMDSFPGSLAQVMTQLTMNALTHAFDGQSGQSGTLSVQVTLLPGDWVELRFADNGRGIPPEHHAKVFEPFFTTRRSGGAVGLGLHITFNIVNRTLGGRIAVESEPGKSTTFILHLPLVAPVDSYVDVSVN